MSRGIRGSFRFPPFRGPEEVLANQGEVLSSDLGLAMGFCAAWGILSYLEHREYPEVLQAITLHPKPGTLHRQPRVKKGPGFVFSAEPGVWKLYAASETSDDRCGGGHRKRNRYSHVRDEPGAQFWGYWGGGKCGFRSFLASGYCVEDVCTCRDQGLAGRGWLLGKAFPSSLGKMIEFVMGGFRSEGNGRSRKAFSCGGKRSG